MKKNCWEIRECGRQPGGGRVGDLGVCIAATDRRLNGVHGGINAGRACWAVVGTLCGGKVQGTFAQKFGNCQECETFRTVYREEVPNFVRIQELLARLSPGR